MIETQQKINIKDLVVADPVREASPFDPETALNRDQWQVLLEAITEKVSTTDSSHNSYGLELLASLKIAAPHKYSTFDRSLTDAVIHDNQQDLYAAFKARHWNNSGGMLGRMANLKILVGNDPRLRLRDSTWRKVMKYIERHIRFDSSYIDLPLALFKDLKIVDPSRLSESDIPLALDSILQRPPDEFPDDKTGSFLLKVNRFVDFKIVAPTRSKNIVSADLLETAAQYSIKTIESTPTIALEWLASLKILCADTVDVTPHGLELEGNKSDFTSQSKFPQIRKF